MPPKPKIPAGQPEIFEIEPRGIQRGMAVKVRLSGTNLLGLTELKLHDPGLKGNFVEGAGADSNQVWIEITAAQTLARGPYELSVKRTNAESSRVKIYVDDLPQAYEPELKKKKGAVLKLPVSVWGVLNPAGNSDEVEFDARAGDSLVLDLAAKSIGSKAAATLAVFDSNGALLASSSEFDGGDPLLHFRVPANGRYHARVGEQKDEGSKDHFYRLSIGTFPIVTSCFPLGVPANRETSVELMGFNLPPNSRAIIKAGSGNEEKVPVDPENFRSRGTLKVAVSDGLELVETEPNDSVDQAMKITVPTVVDARIWGAAGKKDDVDLFRFEAHAGRALIIETDAARRGSPIDTRIEVLDTQGNPVPRVLLESVRDSHVTFKPIDSNTDDLRVENWQEMELNQYMYIQGEVCKIFRMPQGPDSGFQFYSFQNKRRDYFGTSGVAHALDEPAYIVEPHPPGTKLVPNGLPVFTIPYANDDDSDRKLGRDSILIFTPPADGRYIVRVADSRGLSGERFAYRLIVREAQPDFKVTLTGVNPEVNAGSGKEFTLTAERLDGFDGDIRVDISGLPPGFGASTPVVIQAGHLDAKGTIYAAPDAPKPDATNASQTKVVASADLTGASAASAAEHHDAIRTQSVNNFGTIKLLEKPKLFVALEPYDESATNFVERPITDKPLEITIHPGQSVPAWLKIKRNGHEDRVTFGVDGLPHGVIVDNIGLNGVLIAKGEDERKIFLTAAKWVPDIDRLCFAQAREAGTPTSFPLLIHVRKPGNALAERR